MQHRHRYQSIKLLSAILGLLAIASCASNDPAELERALRGGFIGIPVQAQSKAAFPPVRYGEMSEFFKIKAGVKLPLVIYLHGCSGIGAAADEDINMLSKNGFAVIAPDHFSRNYSPSNCGSGWDHDMRIAEARYAYQTALKLPWVDKKNIFLMGHSKGGRATASYYYRGFSARVITGQNCQAPNRPEFHGLHVPGGEPVLSIVAKDDNYSENTGARQGHCGDFMSGTNGSKAIVADSEMHAVHIMPEYQKEIVKFLTSNLK